MDNKKNLPECVKIRTAGGAAPALGHSSPWSCAPGVVKKARTFPPLPLSYRQLTGQLIAPGGSQAERT